MSSQPGSASSAIETAIGRIRDLNERIVSSAQQGSQESITIYEQMLENLAEAQETAGDRGAEWIREFAAAQASFTRQLTGAFPTLLQRLGEHGRNLGGAATEQARRLPGMSTLEQTVTGKDSSR
jgi:uncharacterized membrane protein YqiK